MARLALLAPLSELSEQPLLANIRRWPNLPLLATLSGYPELLLLATLSRYHAVLPLKTARTYHYEQTYHCQHPLRMTENLYFIYTQLFFMCSGRVHDPTFQFSSRPFFVCKFRRQGGTEAF
jgi:hypothetical protein